MTFEPPFVSERQHLVIYPCRISDTQHRHAPVYKLLTNPVDSRITLCADQHLRLAVQRFINRFDQCRRLSRSRWAVDDGDIARAEHFVDSRLLRTVQPRKAYRIQLTKSRFQRSKQRVAQFCQPVAFGADYIFQCFEHRPVRRFVKIKLHAKQYIGSLQFHQSTRSGQHDHHPFLIRITDGSNEIHILHLPLERLMEKADGTSELERVLYLFIFGTCNIYYKLIQRIVVTSAERDGIPAETAFHFPGDAHRFGLPLELFFLVFVLHP